MPWFRRHGRMAAPRRTRLFLESLDSRLLPDGVPLDPPDPPPTQEITPAPTPAAPQITSFTAVEVSTGWYRFSGTVLASSPEGMVVSFGGAPISLQNVTTTVQADGTFSILVQMHTDGTDDGTATAVCTDQFGQTSNTAMTYVTPSH